MGDDFEKPMAAVTDVAVRMTTIEMVAEALTANARATETVGYAWLA